MASLSKKNSKSSNSSSSGSSSEGKFGGLSAPQDKQGMRELVEEIRTLQHQVQELDSRLRGGAGPLGIAPSDSAPNVPVPNETSPLGQGQHRAPVQNPVVTAQRPPVAPTKPVLRGADGQHVSLKRLYPRAQRVAASSHATHPPAEKPAAQPQEPPAKSKKELKPSPRRLPRTIPTRPKLPKSFKEKIAEYKARKEGKAREKKQKRAEEERRRQAELEESIRRNIQKNNAKINRHDLAWPKTVRIKKHRMSPSMTVRGGWDSKGSRLGKRVAVHPFNGTFGIHANTSRSSPLLLVGYLFSTWARIRPMVNIPGHPVEFRLPDQHGTFGFWVLFPKPNGSGKEKVYFSWRHMSAAEGAKLGVLNKSTVGTYWKLVYEPSESEMHVGMLGNVVAAMTGEVKHGTILKFHWGFEKGDQLPLLAVATGLCLMKWERGVRNWMHWQPYFKETMITVGPPWSGGLDEWVAVPNPDEPLGRGDQLRKYERVDHRSGPTAKRDPCAQLGEAYF
ncbi:hypothetical protein B0T14DRAFT_569545 [Immersiella caudata]|uniref:Uncharacterized protein n=1 Tax=Immersiella caudata TaxID=314043 RepID=A0AA39WDQ1_9PEZI|nr:hypothetical protein B0T14DRAFT_569545 [Immersiella caudata]